MPHFIGTDEAGYGPNLGPLVVTATLWACGEDRERPEDIDWYARLSRAVVGKRSARDARIVIADSKQVYQPRGSLIGLERGLFPLFELAGIRSGTWRTLLQQLHGNPHRPLVNPRQTLEEVAWYKDYDRPLPCALREDELTTLTGMVGREFSGADVRLVSIRSAIAFPRPFNGLVEEYGNKSTALSRLTLRLIADLLPKATDGPVLIWSDKHGGRSKYGPMLQREFPEDLIEVRGESTNCSTYCWGPQDRRVTARFVAKGEQFLPAACASMVSKYVREVSMLAFNAYWQAEVPGLKPTAGYPVDARRFRADVAAALQRLEISEDDFWRRV